MFRKFLLACMVMATFTVPIQAISINELNSSPQFKNVYQKSYPYGGDSLQNRMTSYLNTYSVESLEYAAPHYKLKGTFYTVYESPRSTSITEYELTTTYDTNYSLGSLIQAMNIVKPSPSMYAVIKAAQDESGIQVELQEVKRYNGDGTEITSKAPLVHQLRPIDRGRFDEDLFAVADAMFTVAYQQHFDDVVVK
ncbi:MAG: hypothetical protein EGR25_03060 [Veillonella atypica]|nr:hypothetical protein [Veillonella atypica]MBD9033086.1 hypothetical protein [Veillonella atypica]